MVSSRTSLQGSKAETRSSSKVISEVENQANQKMSTRNIFSAIGSKLFGSVQPETKKAEVAKEKHEEKKETEEKVEVAIAKPAKDEKRHAVTKGKKEIDENWKRTDRDFNKFKTKYNNGIGNIMRSWMSVIYCILILRMNVIKLLQENFPEMKDTENQMIEQLREENLVIYKMVRKAQVYSQDRSLFLWTHLEKLIYSRMLIKNALDVMRGREPNKDWKGSAAKLAQAEKELENLRNLHQSLMPDQINRELEKLVDFNATKEKEIEAMIEEIAELKKREVQMRGKILVNMRNFKDLSNKKKYLLGLQKEITQMKINQAALEKEYAAKIKFITGQIERSEKQIKFEREERRKLKADLEVVGDASQKSVDIAE